MNFTTPTSGNINVVISRGNVAFEGQKCYHVSHCLSFLDVSWHYYLIFELKTEIWSKSHSLCHISLVTWCGQVAGQQYTDMKQAAHRGRGRCTGTACPPVLLPRSTCRLVPTRHVWTRNLFWSHPSPLPPVILVSSSNKTLTFNKK